MKFYNKSGSINILLILSLLIIIVIVELGLGFLFYSNKKNIPPEQIIDSSNNKNMGEPVTRREFQEGEIGMGLDSSASSNGLVGYWKFNETSGKSAADSAGGYIGTLVAGPIFTTGKINNALDFANGQYVAVAHNNVLNITGDLTIAMWIKPNSVTCTGADPGYELFAKGVSNGPRPYEFLVGCGGSLRLEAWGTNITYAGSGTVTGLVKTGAWQHIAVTRSFSGITATINFYLNGVNVGTTIQGSGPLLTNTQALWIARGPYFTNYTNEGTYSGLIDEVQLYNRSLLPEEVWDSYQTITL